MDATRTTQVFCDWLQRTPVSTAIQEAAWAVPLLQTVHILSVALVISSSLLLSLRLLGVSTRELSAYNVATRFVPVIFGSLPVLLITGSLLISAEPARSLQNPAFYAKMGFLLLASLLTLAYRLPLARKRDFWDRSRLRVVASKLIAVLSLALWVGVIIAGRWIAYVGNL